MGKISGWTRHQIPSRLICGAAMPDIVSQYNLLLLNAHHTK
jgi:hypothetical protein